MKGLVNTNRALGKPSKLKCGGISTLQNREIKTQRRYNVLQYGIMYTSTLLQNTTEKSLAATKD